jgi:hypothetical protein
MVAITELDGIRILSQDVCDFLQKVPGMKIPDYAASYRK